MTTGERIAAVHAAFSAGRLAEAERACAALLQSDPACLPALHLHALIALSSGRIEAAIAELQDLLRRTPGDAEVHNNLGSALRLHGASAAATASFETAARLDPDMVDAWENLGLTLAQLGRPADAELALRQALERDANRPETQRVLGDLLAARGELALAERHYRAALALQPADIATWNSLGNLLHRAGDSDQAVASFDTALKLNPGAVGVQVNLARVLLERGEIDAAIAAYRTAVAAAPELSLVHTGLLLALHYHPASTAQSLWREHCAWAARHAAPLRAERRPHPNRPDPERRLRLGYVSGELWDHPVAHFLLPLLGQHDRRGFEVFAYATSRRADDMTRRLRACVDHWRDMADLDDAAMAEAIRRDEIDILVDLAAHTAQTRLLVFARKPAPVQVTYLAYCSTTGLDAIDYRISDPHLDPADADLRTYTEATVRLPETYWCYSAPEPAIAPGPSPTGQSGFITFGSLNNFAKVSDATLRVWGRILAAIPTARLLLVAPVGAARARVTRLLAGEGVDSARVEFVGRRDYAGYLATYARIDIALDPFPFAGGTTTCDALWMGVPVITLAGATAVARAGASLLSNLGLPELIATSESDYVERAVRLAADLPRLGALRATLRERLQRSPLMDAPRFARNFEQACRDMWRAWCANTAVARDFAAALAEHQAGRLERAETCYQDLLARAPAHAGAWHLAGVAAFQSGQFDSAIKRIERGVALQPADPEMHNNLGQVLERSGRTREAFEAYQRAITLRPDFAEAHNNAGNVLLAAGQVAAAIGAYREAVRLRPDYAKACYNLGTALRAARDGAAAGEAFRAAIRLQPNWATAHGALGDILRERGELDAALAAYQAGLAVAPGDPSLLNNIALLLRKSGQLDTAIAALESALARQPDLADAELNLAMMLRERGDLPACLAHYRHALGDRPTQAAAHSAFLFNLHYDPATDARTLLAEHRRWSDLHARPFIGQRAAPTNARDPGRRLRIGYVSADLRHHPVGRNVHPLFAHHDHTAFEIFAYAHVDEPDAMTERLRRHVDHWRPTRDATDEELAAQIRRDGIDILVDLSLHTDGNRLLVFARKPAPVAVTFAGYPGTTGLDAIDYRLTDPFLDPPGTRDELYSEQSWRLQHCFWCFDPIGEDIAPRPLRPIGPITWGCLNNPIKITPPVLAAWAEILHATPDSRLVVLAHTEYHRARIAGSLRDQGVAETRIQFVAKLPRPDYLAQYRLCDVMLDTFPYHGHTTTCDALWMGVPVVTWLGETAVARGGWSLLSNVGLGELAATTSAEYQRIALALAADPARLEALHANLRARLQSSPVMDAPGFARQIESAYRAMWRRWCEDRIP